MNKSLLLCLLVSILFSSCAKETQSDVILYTNDFETSDLTSITNGTISTFNGTKVIGFYNNGGFDLTLNDLPEHDLIDIDFDLYIHDSWEGNQQFQDNVNGPDIWQLIVNGQTYINTTFSNIECIPGNFCAPQSYPANFPNNNQNPKAGAASINLPGACSQVSNPTGSTLYRIHKSVSHSESTLLIQFLDKLIQKNVEDKKCDESWSVDNIRIKMVNLK